MPIASTVSQIFPFSEQECNYSESRRRDDLRKYPGLFPSRVVVNYEEGVDLARHHRTAIWHFSSSMSNLRVLAGLMS